MNEVNSKVITKLKQRQKKAFEIGSCSKCNSMYIIGVEKNGKLYQNHSVDIYENYDADGNYLHRYNSTTNSLGYNYDLVLDHELVIDVSFIDENGDPITPKHVGTYRMIVSNVQVNNGDINNYTFEYETESTVEITQRNIYVNILKGLTKVYDGEIYEYPKATDENGIYVEPNYTYAKKSSSSLTNPNEMVEGELLEIYVKFDENPINVGRYTMEFAGFNIINGNMGDYDIHCDNKQSFNVTERIIEIELNSDTKVYDGIAHTYINENSEGYFKNYNVVGEYDTVLNHNLYIYTKYDEDPINVGTYVMSYDTYNALLSVYWGFFTGIIDPIISVVKEELMEN